MTSERTRPDLRVVMAFGGKPKARLLVEHPGGLDPYVAAESAGLGLGRSLSVINGREFRRGCS